MRLKAGVALGAAWLLAGCISAMGEAKAPSDTFEMGLNLGLTLTEGNSETTQFHAALLAEGKRPGIGSLRAGADLRYGESKVEERRETTVDNARAFANARKTLTERLFASLDGMAMYDDIALVDYRTALGPGIGVYLVKSDTTELSMEAGVAYLWEKTEGVRDDFLIARFTERFTHRIHPAAQIWQSVEVLPKASDFGRFLLNAEVGAEAALNTRMNLRLVMQNKHDSEPAAGLEKNDLSLIAGLGFKFQ